MAEAPDAGGASASGVVRPRSPEPLDRSVGMCLTKQSRKRSADDGTEVAQEGEERGQPSQAIEHLELMELSALTEEVIGVGIALGEIDTRNFASGSITTYNLGAFVHKIFKPVSHMPTLLWVRLWRNYKAQFSNGSKRLIRNPMMMFSSCELFSNWQNIHPQKSGVHFVFAHLCAVVPLQHGWLLSVHRWECL